MLFAACDLGVFDAAATGPVCADVVARAAGADPRATRLLMDACAGLGLLRRVGLDGEGRDHSLWIGAGLLGKVDPQGGVSCLV